jgi:hypothetical protein
MSPARSSKRVAAIHLFVVFVLGALGPPARAQVVVHAPPVSVEGTEFTVGLPDARVLRSADLVGAVLRLQSGARVRIDTVETELDPQRRPYWLHTLSAQQADGTWANLCSVGPDGRRAGFPIPGRAREDGTIAEAEPGVFEISCTGGAQAKCIQWGYRPWETRPDGRPVRDVYNACIRMVRADYGGAGHGTTRDGTVIDVYDALGIQTPDMNDEHEFEAAWGPEGAVCVRHPRIKEHVSLDELEREYPQLRGRTGDVCTEELARAHGALLFNRSRP